MPAPQIIILVLVALLLLVSALGPRVAGFIVWGRKENPARLLGAQVELEPDFEKPSLAVPRMTGVVEEYQESSNSYRVQLEAPVKIHIGTLTAVELRGVRDGRPVSALRTLHRRREKGEPVQVLITNVGWRPARATLLRAPRQAVFRRFALPLLFMLLGAAGAAHGFVLLIRDWRLETHGQRIDAYIGSVSVDEERRRRGNSSDICYAIDIESGQRLYGPAWYRRGASCVRVSRQLAREVRGKTRYPVEYDPEHPWLNRIGPRGTGDRWNGAFLMLIGLGCLASGIHELRRS